MTHSILLINSNTSRPPVSPVGLEYVGEALQEAKMPVNILDLAFEADWKTALARKVGDSEPLIVGLSVRNTDDCCFATRKSFLPWTRDVVNEIRRLTKAAVILGGVGFSVMPQTVLSQTLADYGVAGDGEETMVALTQHLLRSDSVSQLHNLVYWCQGNIISNPRINVDTQYMPLPRRRLFDNRRYEQYGAMVGIETKRGCNQRCIFCADPLAKGNKIRLRPPSSVVQEFRDLVAQKVTWFHLCDSEFNLPVSHAKEICLEIIRRRLGDRLNWYTYASPVPFTQEIATIFQRAGCRGINFGVDSGNNHILQVLGKDFTTEDLQHTASICHQQGLVFMYDLLIGGPKETKETLQQTIRVMKQLSPSRVGATLGMRIFPGTKLSNMVRQMGPLNTNPNLHGSVNRNEQFFTPVFYLSSALGENVSQYVSSLIEEDERFFFMNSPEDNAKNYNYNENSLLVEAIRKGYRGAFWDILRRLHKGY